MKKIFTCYWTRKVGILFFVVVLLMMAGMVGVGLLNAQKGSKPEQQEQEHPEQKHRYGRYHFFDHKRRICSRGFFFTCKRLSCEALHEKAIIRSLRSRGGKKAGPPVSPHSIRK